MLTIEDSDTTPSFALFKLGFRPFFLLASLFAAISMLLWMALYVWQANWLPDSFPPLTWHAHEMVFGYSLAVIAGFLLTAVKNWTGQQTLQGTGLILLCAGWLISRVLPFMTIPSALLWMAWFDMAFMSALVIALLLPIIRVRQWKQLPVVLKVGLLWLANLVFYLGMLNVLPPEAIQWGLYSGLYLVISLIMLMGRRVIPFFIEKGVDEEVTLKNWHWLDISSLFLFLAFVIIEVFFSYPLISRGLAAILFILHALRLWGWYTRGIWSKPLLWVLYLGYGFIVAGFALYALSGWLAISAWLPLHAFAAGGIGIITAGMMSRVALGHTGRNVFAPPGILPLIFVLLIIAALVRVFLPLIAPGLYLWWIAIAQGLWILGFGLFVVT